MDKLITRREVEELTGITRSTIYRLMATPASRFPLALRIGRSVRWSREEILEFVRTRERWTSQTGRRDAA